MPTNIKFFQTRIFKINQSGGFLGSLLSKIIDPSMKAFSFTKNILVPLRITAAARVIDAGIQKKINASFN